MTNLLLYQRIAQQLAEDIRRGVYQPGERVPSVRKMSAQLNVSHATVLQAYANLEDQGLIRARPQSGFYVHQTPALTAPTPDIAKVERPGLVTRASIINQVLTESRREGVFPLGAAVPHVDYLPVRALHQQLAKVTRFHSPRAFSYMFSPGFEPLRRQVAIRMRDAGVVVDPSEVVITHGCVDAIHMALRVVTQPGDLIAAESPTYYGLLQLAEVLAVMAEMGVDDIAVVGVAYKDEPVATRAFLDELGDPFAMVLVDREGRAGLDLGISGVPETFAVDAMGRITAKQSGPLLDDADIERLVSALSEIWSMCAPSGVGQERHCTP